MKAIKVFGIVVAAHAAIFLFVFAIPGCRSTGKQKPSSPSAAEPSATPNYGAASSSPIATLPPPAAGDTGPLFVPPAETVRFAPTRPGTPVAGALQAQPTADITPAATYTVVKNDSLWTVAKKNNTTVRELAAANNIRQDAPLRLGQKLIIPGKAPAPSAPAATAGAPTAPGAAAPAATLTYTVKAGDSLALIARRAGTTVDAVKKLNKLRSDTVRAGQQLTLPAGGLASAVTAPAVEASRGAGKSSPGKHIVAPGETAGGIAKKYGVKYSDLVVANNIADPTKLRAGQELIIPGAAASAATPATAPAAAPSPFESPLSPVSPTTAVESPVQPAATPASDSPFVTTPADSASMPVIKVDDAGAPKLQ